MQYYPAKSSSIISKGTGTSRPQVPLPRNLLQGDFRPGITCMARAVALGVNCLETTVLTQLRVNAERPFRKTYNVHLVSRTMGRR